MDGLAREGWSIKDEALPDLQSEAGPDAGALRKLLLDTDLKKIGKASLPEDVNRADSKALKGPFVLQVVAMEDVSTPSKGAVSTSKQRLLMVKLTDGKVTAKAMEYKPLLKSLPGPLLAPGTKVLLTNASVKAGVILLDDKNFQVLGGHVEQLAEAWDFQRRFAGERAEKLPADDQAHAPKFSHFVPGKSKPPPMYLGSSAPPPGAGQQAKQDDSAALPPGLPPPPGFAKLPPSKPPHPPPAAATAPAGGPPQGGAPPLRSIPAPENGAAGVGLGQARADGTAKAKLLNSLAPEAGGRFGRGGGRGGRRRRGRYDDDEDEGSMTLAEFEAQRNGSAGKPKGVPLSDEELARQLQDSLDMEDAEFRRQQGGGEAPLSAAEELKRSMFVPSAPEPDFGGGRRGARGRGRGGRHSGRGRGRGHRG